MSGSNGGGTFGKKCLFKLAVRLYGGALSCIMLLQDKKKEIHQHEICCGLSLIPWDGKALIVTRTDWTVVVIHVHPTCSRGRARLLPLRDCMNNIFLIKVPALICSSSNYRILGHRWQTQFVMALDEHFMLWFLLRADKEDFFFHPFLQWSRTQQTTSLTHNACHISQGMDCVSRKMSTIWPL